MHRTEPSRLQSLSLQLSDKIAQMVDNNERLLEFRGYQGGGGGGRGGYGGGGRFGNREGGDDRRPKTFSKNFNDRDAGRNWTPNFRRNE